MLQHITSHVYQPAPRSALVPNVWQVVTASRSGTQFRYNAAAGIVLDRHRSRGVRLSGQHSRNLEFPLETLEWGEGSAMGFTDFDPPGSLSSRLLALTLTPTEASNFHCARSVRASGGEAFYIRGGAMCGPGCL